jgi:hypothetical protein
MNDLHGLYLTAVAEIERLDVFVSHDSAGNGSHGSFSALPVKFLSASGAFDHVDSLFNFETAPVFTFFPLFLNFRLDRGSGPT